MDANEILGIILALTFMVMGVYFNNKFKQIDNDEDLSHKKI